MIQCHALTDHALFTTRAYMPPLMNSPATVSQGSGCRAMLGAQVGDDSGAPFGVLLYGVAIIGDGHH